MTFNLKWQGVVFGQWFDDISIFFSKGEYWILLSKLDYQRVGGGHKL